MRKFQLETREALPSMMLEHPKLIMKIGKKYGKNRYKKLSNLYIKNTKVFQNK